jgi:hypothetical protein
MNGTKTRVLFFSKRRLHKQRSHPRKLFCVFVLVMVDPVARKVSTIEERHQMISVAHKPNMIEEGRQDQSCLFQRGEMAEAKATATKISSGCGFR